MQGRRKRRKGFDDYDYCLVTANIRMKCLSIKIKKEITNHPLNKKTTRFSTNGSVEVVFLYLLDPKVSKSLVGFSHTMGIFFLFKCCAFTF